MQAIVPPMLTSRGLRRDPECQSSDSPCGQRWLTIGAIVEEASTLAAIDASSLRHDSQPAVSMGTLSIQSLLILSPVILRLGLVDCSISLHETGQLRKDTQRPTPHTSSRWAT